MPLHRSAADSEEWAITTRRFAHLLGEHARLDVVTRIQAAADSNIERYGLDPGDRHSAGEGD